MSGITVGMERMIKLYIKIDCALGPQIKHDHCINSMDKLLGSRTLLTPFKEKCKQKKIRSINFKNLSLFKRFEPINHGNALFTGIWNCSECDFQ